MNDDSRQMILPSFPPEYRASGMLLHVPSLPSPYGIGDVRPAAGGGSLHLGPRARPRSTQMRCERKFAYLPAALATGEQCSY